MKIAVLHFEDISRPVTGYGTYLLNLSRSLQGRGHKVEILNLFDSPGRVRLWGDRWKRSMYSLYWLLHTSKLGGYDIILFAEPIYPQNMLLLRLIKRRIKTSIVLWLNIPRIVSGLYYFPINQQFPALITGEIARPFAEKIAFRVELLLPGLDTTALYPQEKKKQWDFLYVGHLFPEKGVELLLQAMKVQKEKQSPLTSKILHIPCREDGYYCRYITDHGLHNVDMETAIIEDHLAVYNSARVYVYPGISHQRVVDIPLTIIEASACGLPVVTTSLYGHIRLPNIVLADSTPESLAEAMERTLAEWDGEKQARCLFTVQQEHSLESLGKKAEAYFSGLLNGRG